MKVPKQPEVNIGMIGHVDHGKTTLTRLLTGEWTDRHSEELKRGISIRLGYADTAIFQCPECEGPFNFTTKKKCPNCKAKTEFVRAISFVDSPGHETLMATMLSGAALMDGAILLVAANETCPQPQTKEHLMALEISGVKNIIVVQNKIDLVDAERAKENYEEIKEFLQGTVAEGAPIIPLCAHHDVNTDVLITAIQDIIPTPEKDAKSAPRMYVARSFDVNVPGSDPEDLKGGVLGGSITEGEIKVGDEIQISPGHKVEEKGRTVWKDINTTVTSLLTGGKTYKKVSSGGLIGIGTELDPFITKSDGLIGRIVGLPGQLPPVLLEMKIETHLLDRVVGTTENTEVEGLKPNEPLMLSIGTATTVGIVRNSKRGIVEVGLKLPICAEEGHRVAISRRLSGRWRLIGYGIIT